MEWLPDTTGQSSCPGKKDLEILLDGCFNAGCGCPHSQSQADEPLKETPEKGGFPTKEEAPKPDELFKSNVMMLIRSQHLMCPRLQTAGRHEIGEAGSKQARNIIA